MPNSKSQNQRNKPVAKNQEVLPAVYVRPMTVSYISAERERLTFETYQNRNKVPYLRLSGTWMHEAGFKISSKVNVIVKNNLLIIENITP